MTYRPRVGHAQHGQPGVLYQLLGTEWTCLSFTSHQDILIWEDDPEMEDDRLYEVRVDATNGNVLEIAKSK